MYLISQARYSPPTITLPLSVCTSYEVPKRWFVKLAVSGMTCMVPIPPSQARIVDCQPLSCQATACIRFTGTLIDGALVAQKCVPAAVSSAPCTVALVAPGPVYVGQVAP